MVVLCLSHGGRRGGRLSICSSTWRLLRLFAMSEDNPTFGGYGDTAELLSTLVRGKGDLELSALLQHEYVAL